MALIYTWDNLEEPIGITYPHDSFKKREEKKRFRELRIIEKKLEKQRKIKKEIEVLKRQDAFYCISCQSQMSTLYCSEHNYLRSFSGRDLNREKVRIRDAHTCQLCKKKWQEGNRRFHIHHIETCGKNSRGYDTLEDFWELITLCHKCHLGLHSVRKKMSEQTGENKNSKHKSTYYKNNPRKRP